MQLLMLLKGSLPKLGITSTQILVSVASGKTVCVLMQAIAHTCTHTHTYIHTHTYMYMYTRTHTHSHTYTLTHTCTHTHTFHTHTHTHTHRCSTKDEYEEVGQLPSPREGSGRHLDNRRHKLGGRITFW